MRNVRPTPGVFSAPALAANRYVLKKQLLKIFGEGFGIYDEHGNRVLQADEALLTWRNHIDLSGGFGTGKVLGIYAKSWLSFASQHDVVDLQTGTGIGTLQRKWIQSMLRDEWTIFDALGRPVGTILEDTQGLAILRRLVASLIPQTYEMTMNGCRVATFRQNFNPFTFHLTIDFHVPPAQCDRRLGIAAAVLLASVERRQESGVGLIGDAVDVLTPF